MKTTLAFAAVLSFATSAHAGDSRAWTAGRKVLPANLQMIVGVSFDSLRSSQTFAALMPQMMKTAGGAKDKIEMIKKTCGITLTDQLDSAVLGATADEKGVVVIALKSTSRKDLESCMQKVAKADNKTVTIAEDGQVTKYSGMTDKKQVYLRWLSKDTFAFSTTGDNKDELMKMTDGGVSDDKKLKAALGVINTNASIWIVLDKEQDLSQVGAKMQSAYGTADVKAGNIAADLHIVVKDAKSATDAAANATGQVDALKKSGRVPAEFGPILNGIKFKGAGSELVVDATIPEKDLLTLLSQFMK